MTNKSVLLEKVIFSTSLFQILLAGAFAAGILWLSVYRWRNRNLYRHSRKVKGPPTLPIVGNAYLFIGLSTNGIMELLAKVYQRYEDIFRIWFGPYLLYCISKPEYLETIFNSPKSVHKDHFYIIFRRVAGNGLITAPTEMWKAHRKVIAPTFNQTILNSFMEIFVEKCNTLNYTFSKHAQSKDMDLFYLFSRCTLDTICEAVMGVKLNLQTTDCDFVKNFDRLSELGAESAFNLLAYSDFIYKLLPSGRESFSRIKKFQDFTEMVVREKLAKYHKEKDDKLTASVERLPRKMAFLDYILRYSNFTEQEIRDEVNVFILAGSDTSAITLTCWCMCMGIHQDIQQKVLDEVLSVVDSDRKITASDLSKLKYTELVLKETLRLFPPAVIFLRGVYEDLDIGDFTLPAGSTVFLHPPAVHRNPKYWPDPLKFIPERFLPENSKNRHPCAYIPFSYGPRNCVGIKYSMMFMKTMVATMLRKYKIFCEYKSIDEIELKANIVLRLKNGAKVWMEERSL